MNLPLVASIAALFVGPLIVRLSRTQTVAAAVDAFALVSVGGLVLAHIMPQSYALAGWWILPSAILGLAVPGYLCSAHFSWRSTTGRLMLGLALVGVALHALLDGVAMAPEAQPADGSPNVLALAVVLHRLPVGLAIWWLALPLFGLRGALVLIGTLSVSSTAGAYFGGEILGAASQFWIGVFQSLVAGSLLHIILRHTPVPSLASPESVHAHSIASAIGGVLGCALVLGLERLHVESGAVLREAGVGARFVELFLETAPALLLAYGLVAAMHVLQIEPRKLLAGGTSFGQAMRGTFIGIPVQLCSCGVIPLYKKLVEERVPTPAAMSFLIATPELELAALLLSWSMLGSEIAIVRTVSGIALALAVGLIVGRRAPPPATLRAPERDTEPAQGIRARIAAGLSHGFGAMVDGTAPWIILGLALAAACEPLLEPGLFAGMPRGLDVPLFALIGIPLYVCASGSTPLAALLIAKGASPGAAIAFLLTGPATNVTTFGMLARLHGRKTALLFGLVVFVVTVALGFAANAFLEGRLGGLLPSLHPEGASSALAKGCALALALVFGISLLRQGTRGFVEQVIRPHAQVSGEAGHEHHDHGHAHGESACCESVP